MKIATTSFVRFGVAAVLAVTALGGMAAATSGARAAGDLAAEQGPNALTCVGSGFDHYCRYCIVYDGGTDCAWYKVPDFNRPAASEPRLTAGNELPGDGSEMTPIRNLRGTPGE